MRGSELTVKLFQVEGDGGAEAEAAKGGVEDEESGEGSGQSLEASNEQDGRVPGQHDDEDDEQGWMDGGISSCWYFF